MDRDELQRDLERLHPSCFGWALACCRWRREDAEEALQTAYVKALDGRARFDGRSSLKSWFFGVIRLTSIEQRRRRLARRLGLARWLAREADGPPTTDPELQSSDAESRRRLRSLLDRLTERQRALLHLVFYEGLTIEEAAGVLSISIGTARTHYQRGKARMRLLLEEREGRHATAGSDRTAASRSVCGG